MIKIGIIALARQINGGTLPYTFSMIDALAELPKSNYSVTIFTQKNNDEFDGYNFPKQSIKSTTNLFFSRLLGLKTGFEEMDVVLAPVYSIRLLLIKKPFIFTLHDLQERYFPENFPFAVRVWRKLINWMLTKKAVGTICESSYVKKDIIKFIGVPSKKIHVIPAPPQISLLHNSDAKKLTYLPNEYIFYPAQFWPHKNHLRLIEAFKIVRKEFPNIFLVLTGKEAFNYKKVKQKILSLGLEQAIIHIGYIPQDEMSSIYRNASLLVMPTLFESISIPMYEAFALGIPVCASNVLALPEQMDGAGLLFDPLDKEDIAKKIIAMLSSAELRAICIAKGLSNLKDKTIENYSIQLDALIGDIPIGDKRRIPIQ
jgi:glycosyltransferase involved in cell wall biosynthesis